MASAIEQVFFTNALGIMGNNVILLAVFFIAVVSILLFYLDMSKLIVIPILFGFMLIMAGGSGSDFIPQLKVILGLVGGLALGWLIYSFWKGG